MKGIIGLVLSGLALLLNIVGIAIPFWLHVSEGDFSKFFGLWYACKGNGGKMDCFLDLDVARDPRVKGVLVLELLGMIGMIVATVCMLLKLLVMKDKEMMPKIAGAVAIVSGILMIIGAVIFATLERVDNSELQSGFVLCIVAGVIALPAGVFDVLNK